MRRAFLIFFSIIMVSILISGCSTSEQINNDNQRFSVSEITAHLYLMTDKKTRVQYIKVYKNTGSDGGVAITVLLSPNGKPYIGDGKNQSNRFIQTKVDGYTSLLTDRNTSVQYLITFRNTGADGGMAITPLYKANGNPYSD